MKSQAIFHCFWLRYTIDCNGKKQESVSNESGKNKVSSLLFDTTEEENASGLIHLGLGSTFPSSFPHLGKRVTKSFLSSFYHCTEYVSNTNALHS